MAAVRVLAALPAHAGPGAACAACRALSGRMHAGGQRTRTRQADWCCSTTPLPAWQYNYYNCNNSMPDVF